MRKTMRGPRWVMPPEWAPHEATWLVWPQNPTDWPGKTVPVRWAYAEMIRAMIRGEHVRVVVGDRRVMEQARRFLRLAHVDSEKVVFPIASTDRAWVRDSGAIFARTADRRNDRVALGFGFNAWAKYPDWQRDARLSARMARAAKAPLVKPEWEGRRVVLEGGSIDVNGVGDLLTTEECLLDRNTQVRNPGLSREDLQAVFARYLGVRQTIWLGRGIAGDDTHGHVDDIARFVDAGTIVLCEEKNAGDVNHRALEENRERLESARLADGSRPRMVRLPMPGPVGCRGMRLPASYANFYITNAEVLVPTFNDPHDRHALGILADLFPGRTVRGIHAVDLVLGQGAIHCLTQQEIRAIAD